MGAIGSKSRKNALASSLSDGCSDSCFMKNNTMIAALAPITIAEIMAIQVISTSGSNLLLAPEARESDEALFSHPARLRGRDAHHAG